MRPSPPPPASTAPLTLADSIADAARAGDGDRSDAGQGWAALNETSARLACGLLGLRLRRGDRIGILGEQLADWPLLFFAATRIGVTVLALRPPSGSADAAQAGELEAQLAHSGVKLVFTPQRHQGCDLIAVLARLVPRLPALRHVIAIDGDGLNGLAALAATPLEPGPLSVAQRRVLADDIAMLVYAPGRGEPPAVTALSHRSLLAGAAAPPAAAIGLQPQGLLRAPLTAPSTGRPLHTAGHR